MKKLKYTFIIIILIQMFFFIFDINNVVKASFDGKLVLAQEDDFVDANNTNLKVLRLNQEGITPSFQKQIKEYYIIISEEIHNLTVTAIPENLNSKVEIIGNINLKSGKNTIYIKVNSENKKQTDEYKIHVTKTDDMEAANANLENLAVENVMLMPDFQLQCLNYKAEVENEVEEINILAIPQNPNAHVKILGNKELKEGNNIVQILVYAQNQITLKKYEIQVYRKTPGQLHQQNHIEDTQTQNEIESGFSAQRTSFDNSKEIKEVQSDKRKQETKNGLFFLWGVAVLSVVIGMIGIIFYYFSVKKK